MIPLRIVSEVISCFITKEFNTDKEYSYIINEFNYNKSKNKIYEIYTAIRNIIYKYLKFEYRTTPLAEENENGFFSADESLIAHRNNRQIWLLGIINNTTKDFRIEGTYERTTSAIKKFITFNVKSGNNIITDGFTSYNFLDRIDSGYTHFKHDHSGGDFGFGQESTSHIESIWSQLKAKIKDTYYTIPEKNVLHFVREAEFKIKLRSKSGPEKIKEFFSCYDFLSNVKDVEIEDKDFLTDSSNNSDYD